MLIDERRKWKNIDTHDREGQVRYRKLKRLVDGHCEDLDEIERQGK